MSLEMEWYLIKVCFRVIYGNGNHKAQFNEQVRLVTTGNMAEAVEKLKRIAVIEAQDIICPVKWQLVAVTEVMAISEAADGAEISSVFLETDDADEFMYLLKKKEAGNLQPAISINK